MVFRHIFAGLLLLAGASCRADVIEHSALWGNSGLQQATAVARDAAGNTWLAGWTDSATFPVTNNGSVCGQGVDAFLIELDTSWNVILSMCLSGDGDDRAAAIALDQAGNIYVAGATTSSELAGVSAGSSTSGTKGFVASLNPSATRINWVRFIGGSERSAINALAVSPKGDVYVAGETSSPDLPATGPQVALRGTENAFIAHFNSTGALLSCSYLGGGGVDRARAIAVDGKGSIWIGGDTTSTDFPLVAPFQNVLGGAQTAFVAQYSPGGGELVLSTYLGGSGGTLAYPETANSIAVDSGGNAYVAGTTPSTNFPVMNAVQGSIGGISNGFVTSFDPTGRVRFSTYLGGSLSDCATSIAVLENGALVIAGYTTSPDFPITADGQTPASDGYSGFVTTLDLFGRSILFSTVLNSWSSEAESAVLNANPSVVAGVATAVISPGSTFASASEVVLPLSSMIASALRFKPIPPCRVADTRVTGTPLSAGETREFAFVGGSCNVPSTSAAYSVNATVVPENALGYITVWPAGLSRPLASTLNSLDGRIKANAAIVPAGVGGALSVYATDATDVVLDINGCFVPAPDASGLAFYPIRECRIADTRAESGPSLQGGVSRQFMIAGSCGVPSGAEAYSLNVTVIPHKPLGYLTLYPSDMPRPVVSTLNALNGAITANAAIVPAGSGGSIDAYATSDTDLVIDIDGYFASVASGALFLYNLGPCRALDTRVSANGAPLNGEKDFDIGGSACGGAMTTAQAYVFNATAIPSPALGYLTLWPQGEPRPIASTLNALDGAITSNMAIVSSTNGSISAYTSNPSQLVLDVSGYLAP